MTARDPAAPTALVRDDIRALVRDDAVHRDVYTDPALFRLEMERLWSRAWIYVGHASQIPRTGDYATCDIGLEPVLMIRQPDDTIRVLRNRCAHKGARIVADRAGNAGRFLRCPYHNWSYRTDGSIAAIPLRGGYDPARLAGSEAARGLRPVADRSVSRFRVCSIVRERAGLSGVFRRIALFHRLHGGSLAERRDGGRRRRAAIHARQQLEAVRREPERHHAPDGGA